MFVGLCQRSLFLEKVAREYTVYIHGETAFSKTVAHPNIVKYKGFVKTPGYLYIILEYAGRPTAYGSHNICKRFGKFLENLVAVYISQVLEGLVYLHDQGVIHRDIKGANTGILTTKDGWRISGDAVVGSPYWISQSDIHVRNALGKRKVVRRNVESYIPDVLQPLSFEQGSTGGGGASRDYTFTRARDRVELSSQTVCTSHPLRPFQYWEELSDVAVAARWAVDVYQAAHRSLLPSFRRLILIPHRLQEETARVEDKLAKPKSLDALLTPPASQRPSFLRRITEKLGNSKAVVKLNLVRILRTVCDVHPNRALLVERYGIVTAQ
ncbi:kinase-like domain-containing protein [Russula emetica]|nr:kinase-like domain-containing protein [Russula emetica]